MQPLQICIGPIIRIGQESWCLPYAGFFKHGLNRKLFYSSQLKHLYQPSNRPCTLLYENSSGMARTLIMVFIESLEYSEYLLWYCH